MPRFHLFRYARWTLVLLACLPARGALAETSALRVDNLRCQGAADPLGIEEQHPLLSWNVAASKRGAVQTAYHVLAASRTGLLREGTADLWDSGKVVTADQQAAYAGAPLASGMQIFWAVRLWDGAGVPGEWSAPAQWSMGLLPAEDWGAQWIAGPEAQPLFEGAQWLWSADCDGLNAPPGPRFFRCSVTLSPEASLQSARLRILADNEFAVCVNGRRAGAEKGWMVLGDYDVTDRLAAGKNAIAVEAVNGGEAGNPAGVIVRLDLEYKDGSRETVLSDETWRGAAEPQHGWRQPEFDDAGWPLVRAVGPYGMEPWGEAVAAQPRAMPIFRREFTVVKPLKRALACVCGLGHFELACNGVKAGGHVFDPGWTDYRDTCLYVPFDVTALLRPGANALGVMLGNGMYNVTGGRYVKFTGSFGEPKLIAHLRLEYEDGTVETLGSDASWKTSSGPITFSCAYGGEDYDARKEQDGWNRPGFDDSRWTAARLVGGPGGVLRVSEAPPVTVASTQRPVRTEQQGPGELRFDLGLNLSARPFFTVRGAPGDRITVRVGELADTPWEGHSYTYTLRGGGEETYRPYFTYFGFQYLFVSGADLPADAAPDSGRPQLIDAGSEFVTSSAPAVGAFNCNVELLNEIDAMIGRSVRSNLQSVLTDCPHREKLGWLEVSHLMGPSILYHFDTAGLFRKICRDTTESQLENGMVPDIAPEYTRFSQGFFESAEWGSACVQLPWLLYRWYGDRAIVTRQFDTMAKYTRYLASTRNEQGLAKGGLGDWYDWTPEKGHAGYAQLTPLELTATALLYDDARIVAAAADMSGRAAETREFTELAERVREDFIAAYYDPAAQTVAGGSQAALAMALHFGFVPEPDRDAVLENLVCAVEGDHYRPTTGEVCFRYLVRALADAGRSDVVYRIIDRTDPPGYGCMLRQYGLKTLSEQWDKPGSSLNHCMFGHIQEWFQGDVLGIRQAEGSVGFERLRIAPSPVGALLKASGHYDSPRGRIEVTWEKTDAVFALGVTIPGNTTAEIVLPAGSGAVVTESGAPVGQAQGVLGVRSGESETVVTVGSGAYAFTCAPKQS